MKFNQNKTSVVQRNRMRSALRVASHKRFERSKVELVSAASSDGINHAYLKELIARGDVEYAEENGLLFANSTVPNDSRYNELWGLHNTGQNSGTPNIDIDAPEAWDYTQGSNTVVVGIIDTGVNYNHPDLSANMWTNPGEIAGNGIDDDSNGIVDDVHGANFVSDNGNPNDDNGHGSHCAGTIGGRGNNGVGVAGVNWQVKIMALKFLSSNGSGYTSDAIAAIEYAIAMKNRGVNIRVLNNSWGGGSFSQSLRDAISASNNAGILFVAAAGNEANDNNSSPSYPASYNVANVISVAAVDRNGNLASFSNYGNTSVDLGAPGVSILSTVLGSNYSSFSGTSMAAPHVSGVAALVLSREPSLSLVDLKSRLLTTVKPLSTLNGLVRYPGIVNAFNALTSSQTVNPPAPPVSYYSKVSQSFAPESDLGNLVLNIDDGYYRAALPFNMNFYGSNYSSVDISSNGRAIFANASDPSPTENDYVSRMRLGVNIYSSDLYPSPHSAGGVYLKSSATEVAITWVMVPYGLRASGSALDEIRVQMRIFSSGRIEFHFIDTALNDSSYNSGGRQTVGLGAPTGYESVVVTENVSKPAELGSSMALAFTHSGSSLGPGGPGNGPPLTNSPAEADVDGDGNTDLTVYNSFTGLVTIATSSSGYQGLVKFSIPKYLTVFGCDIEGVGRRNSVVGFDPKSGNVLIYKASNAFTKPTVIKRWMSKDDRLVGCGKVDDDNKDDLVYAVKGKGLSVLKSKYGFSTARAKKKSASYVLNIKSQGVVSKAFVANTMGGNNPNRIVTFMNDGSWRQYDGNGTLVSYTNWGQSGDGAVLMDWFKTGYLDLIATRNSNYLSWYALRSNGEVASNHFGPAGSMPFSYGLRVNGVIMQGFVDANGWIWLMSPDGANSLTFNFGSPGDLPV
jgi:subtilisin family serine protease